MRLFFIAAFAVFIFAGVVSGSFFLSSQNAHAASPEKGDDGGFKFVDLGALVLPIVDGNGVSQTVSMIVVLEVKNSFAVAKVEKYQPKLKDAFIQDMYGVLSDHASMKGGLIQIGMIKHRLNKISDRVMGDEDVVQDVLLQAVQQRPI